MALNPLNSSNLEQLALKGLEGIKSQGRSKCGCPDTITLILGCPLLAALLVYVNVRDDADLRRASSARCLHCWNRQMFPCNVDVAMWMHTCHHLPAQQSKDWGDLVTSSILVDLEDRTECWQWLCYATSIQSATDGVSWVLYRFQHVGEGTRLENTASSYYARSVAVVGPFLSGFSGLGG